MSYNQGPWAWKHLTNKEGKHVATQLVTRHPGVPHNDPVIFALREDWMQTPTGTRAKAMDLILAAPELRDALILARQAMIKALPHLDADKEAIHVGESLAEVNETLGKLFGWKDGQPAIPKQ